MENFLQLMADILDVDVNEISLDTVFRKECDFDSLKGFSMICTMEEEYDREVTVDQFLECKTLGDLYKYI